MAAKAAPFKSGDVVVRTGRTTSSVIRGEQYKVFACTDDEVFLEGIADESFNPYYFKHAPAPALKPPPDKEETHMANNFKVGDWVMRIKEDRPPVMVGQVYQVSEVWNNHIYLRGIAGPCYRQDKFQPAQAPEPQVNPIPDPSNGVKYDSDKPRMDLVLSQLPSAMLSLGSCLGYGAAKYSEDNWIRVPDAPKRYMAAALRHILAFQQGEELDPESGRPHLTHAATNLMFVLELNLRDKK